MRKLVVGTFLTVDGVMQAPGGPEEDRDGGFEHGLVDEFNLWVFPVTIGSGKRLFGDGTMPGAFRLVDAKPSSTGVVIQRYERVGKLEHGSFAVDERGKTAALWEDKS